MSDVFIHEFLFRGGPTSSPDDDTWHVLLAREEIDTLDGRVKLEVTTALTPERAADMGFPLSRILSEINQSAMEQATRYKREAEEAQAKVEELEARLRGPAPAPAGEDAPADEKKQSLLGTLTLGLLK